MNSLSCTQRGVALLLKSLRFEHLLKVKKFGRFITSMFCAWSFRLCLCRCPCDVYVDVQCDVYLDVLVDVLVTWCPSEVENLCYRSPLYIMISDKHAFTYIHLYIALNKNCLVEGSHCWSCSGLCHACSSILLLSVCPLATILDICNYLIAI